MRRLFLLLCVVLCGCGNLSEVLETGTEISRALGGTNSQTNLVKGLKDTLELSSTRASNKLSQPGAYLNNPLYKITLPQTVQTASSVMRQFGLGQRLDEVERLMNQGAEQAAIQAGGVFIQAVKQMSINDAVSVVQGGPHAATDYFEAKTYTQLEREYQPIIAKNLQQVGFYNEYKQLLSVYKTLPIANKPELDLEKHVLDNSLKSLFKQVAKEEAAIRQDPVGRGSEFISSIFKKS